MAIPPEKFCGKNGSRGSRKSREIIRMIRHDCAQGSHEWNMLRLGKPTASVFDRIVTPGGKLSSQSQGLMCRLLVELFGGVPLEGVTTAAMNTGREREPEARAWYEAEREMDVALVGICFTDDGCIGASPDGMVGSTGLLEIKCPEPQSHVNYLLLSDGIAQAYKPQIQGQLWVAEREWLDSVSYCPGWPPSLVRVPRDEDYIAVLSASVREFSERLAVAADRLIRMGAQMQPRAQEVIQDGGGWLGVSEADVDAILEGRK